MSPVGQLSLLADVARTERPWKVVRKVSRQVYAELRKGGYCKRSALKVLTALAWYRNQSMTWPTVGELTQFMFERRRIARNDPRVVAPRISEMVKGCTVRLPDGTRVTRGGGVLVYLPKRRCLVTQTPANPIAIREAGSRECDELQRSDVQAVARVVRAMKNRTSITGVWAVNNRVPVSTGR